MQIYRKYDIVKVISDSGTSTNNHYRNLKYLDTGSGFEIHEILEQRRIATIDFTTVLDEDYERMFPDNEELENYLIEILSSERKEAPTVEAPTPRKNFFTKLFRL